MRVHSLCTAPFVDYTMVFIHLHPHVHWDSTGVKDSRAEETQNTEEPFRNHDMMESRVKEVLCKLCGGLDTLVFTTVKMTNNADSEKKTDEESNYSAIL